MSLVLAQWERFMISTPQESVVPRSSIGIDQIFTRMLSWETGRVTYTKAALSTRAEAAKQLEESILAA